MAERRFAEGVGTGLEVYDAYVNQLTAETSLLQAYYQLDTAYLTALILRWVTWSRRHVQHKPVTEYE